VFSSCFAISRSSYGTVWKAHDFKSGGLVAVKVLSLAGMTTHDLENVQREQDIHRELRSPYITRYIGSYWSEVDSQFWVCLRCPLSVVSVRARVCMYENARVYVLSMRVGGCVCKNIRMYACVCTCTHM
jgi:serine/threonine protein kinase